jgi:hypothetical protein
MDTDEVMETLERNLSHQVIALTEGIFKRYANYQKLLVKDEVKTMQHLISKGIQIKILKKQNLDLEKKLGLNQ